MHLSLPRRRAGLIICCFKNLDRKRLSLSLGPKRAWRVMDGSTSDPTHPPSCQHAAVGGSRASSKATHAPSTKLWKQVNVHRTLRPPPGEGHDGTGPSSRYEEGFFSLYIIVPKKSGGLRPILGLRILNWAFHKPLFKMLMQNRIFGCIRPQVWSAASDLKDPYFHVSILPRHRPFLQFAFEGRAYQYKVLPFGLSLSPRVFTKVAEAALVPLREQGVRILNYLDDWLILFSLRISYANTGIWCSRTSASWAFGSTGKRANSCRRRGSLFPVWSLDSVNQTACLTQETRSVGVELLEYVQEQDGSTTETCSTPGLEPSRDAYEASTYWSVQTALRPLRTLTNKVVYAPVACRNSPATLLLLWSQKHLRSLRAIHILGLLNRTADKLSRAALPGEWRLCPQTVQLIWRCFGLAQLDLFASLETFHCQLFYSLTEGTLGTDTLAHSWHCARSGRKRSSSCSWHHTGPPGLGSQS